jgi:glucose/arabinose dehydrogenase
MTDTRFAVNRFRLTPLIQAMLLAVAGTVLIGCNGSTTGHQTDPPLTNSPFIIGEAQPEHIFHFRLGDSVLIDTGELDFADASLASGAADANSLSYSISPQLPSGLTLDEVTGQITGTVTTLSEPTDYTISLNTESTNSHQNFLLGLHPALPEALHHLDSRYSAEVLVADAKMPVRMVLAPDGRLFYNELKTGHVRVVNQQGALLQSPFATLEIQSVKEKGLLGLTLDPEFGSNGYLYVYATVPGHDSEDPHAEIIRYTASQDRAVDKTVIVDNLPVADLHNGGELLFDQSGHLFLGRGDIDDAATAQLEGSLSGLVLRYTKDGGIPSDNPYPGSAEWSRGLRNTFAMAIQPETGDLFGADAGPASDDKLNYLQPGKNFVWGMEDEPQGSGIGFTIRVWAEVITPTALFFHSGAGDSRFKNQLFLASYNDATVRRMIMVGDRFTDYLRELEFAVLDPQNALHKPLHVMEGQNGDIYLSTFNAIYRLYLH